MTARRLSEHELKLAVARLPSADAVADMLGHIEALEAELAATDTLRQLEADAKRDAVLRFESARDMHRAAETERGRLRAELAESRSAHELTLSHVDRLRDENARLHEELVNKRDEVECQIAVALRGEGWPHAPSIAAWIERGDYCGERSSASPAKEKT